MKLVIVGLNHKTAPVAIREKIAFLPETIPDALKDLAGLAPACLSECAILSTCNRVEIFFVTQCVASGKSVVERWLSEKFGYSLESLRSHLYCFTEREAVVHGFRVTASLDSQIVGEPQILGQVKQAYQKAGYAGTSSVMLSRFFHSAFRTAKRVRSETTIAQNAVSIAYAGVELAKKIFRKLEEHTCLLIGAGEMCELAARHLVANGLKDVLVTNRTMSRAETLARDFDGKAFPLTELFQHLHLSDIIIASTGSPDYLVNADMVKQSLKKRRQSPMFFIDLAVPRDFDPEIGAVDSAFLYDIDDLTQVVDTNKKERDRAASEASAIVLEEAELFEGWLNTLEIVPTIVALREKLETIRDHSLDKAFKGWANLSNQDRERVETLTRLIVNRILHDPVSRLKTLAIEEESERYIDALRRLFNLNHPNNQNNQKKS